MMTQKCGCGRFTDHKICKGCDTVMSALAARCPTCEFKKATLRCRKCAAENMEEKQKDCYNLLPPDKKLAFSMYLKVSGEAREEARAGLLEGLSGKQRDLVEQFTVAQNIYRSMRT